MMSMASRVSGDKSRSNNAADKPLIELSGVRSSWLMFARNRDFICADSTAASRAEIIRTAELFLGKQCSGDNNCQPLESHRVYAGAAVNVKLKPGFKANYTVKIVDKISTATFD